MTDTILEKDTIHVVIGEDHSFNCTAVTIGRTGENSVTQLEIEIPSELNAFDAYLDFKKPKGQTKCTERLAIVNNVIEYDIQGDLLIENGNLEVQLVLRRADGDIWKSATKKFVVLKSIDAEENIPDKEDFITEAQKILDNAVGCSASAIQLTASGNPICLDDVSPLEHKMSVLAKGSVDVLGAGLEIKHYGKNLFDDVAFFEQRGFAKQSDGSYKGINLSGVIAISNESKASGSIYISYLGKTDSNQTPVCFKVVYTDGAEYLAHLNTTNGVFVKISAQTNSAKTVDRIEWYYGNASEYYIKDLMFSFVDDEYEPYKEPVTYTTDENGEVSVTSIYPATTLIASEGVTVAVDYNADTKKYIDRKFAELASMIAGS